MDTVTQVQILDEAVCVSHNSITFGKGMNLTVLHLGMGKITGQTKLFTIGMACSLGERKLWI